MKGVCNMKKYDVPEMDIVRFETEDVITDSSGYNSGDNEGPIL